ncbi:MAG: PKD domain-containing protein [Dehalococcoidia bacterium]
MVLPVHVPLCPRTAAGSAFANLFASPTTSPQGAVTVLNGPYRVIGGQAISISAVMTQPAAGRVILTYMFNFGDDPTQSFVTSPSPTITHTFASSGTFLVTLVVTSACQETDADGVALFDSSGNPLLDIRTASTTSLAVVSPPLPNCFPATGAGPFGPTTCGVPLTNCGTTSATNCQASGCTAAAAGCVGTSCTTSNGIGCSPGQSSCLAGALPVRCLLPPACGIGQAAGACAFAPSCNTILTTAGICTTSCTTQGLGQALQAEVCPQPPSSTALGVQASAGGPYQGQVNQPVQFGATLIGTLLSTACTDGSNYGVPGLACTTSSDPAAGSASFLWDFGDGATASGQTVGHTYAAPGAYTVTLTLSLGAAGLLTPQTTATITSPASLASSANSGVSPSASPGGQITPSPTPSPSASPQTNPSPTSSLSPSPSASPSAGSTLSSTSGTRDNPLPVGTVGDLGDGWQVSVLSTTSNANSAISAASSSNAPPAQNEQYFLARVSATYAGSGSQAFNATVRLRAVGPSGVSYSLLNNGCGVVPDEFPSSRQVFTGGTVTGNVCFAVLMSDAASLLLYNDESFNLGGLGRRIYFALSP